MKGYIVRLGQNKDKKKGYGFIRGEDFIDYFFHASFLKNRYMTQISVGDEVEFDPSGMDQRGHYEAKNIMVLTSSTFEAPCGAIPGIHESVDLSLLTDQEKTIIERLGQAFYVTSVRPINIGDSLYSCCYLKPTDFFVKTFKMTREIVAVISNYLVFQPRCFEVADKVFRQNESRLRVDRSFHILISKDDNINEDIKPYMIDGELKQAIIPFSFSELTETKNAPKLIQDKFRKYLFDKDLFSVSSPIDHGIFFFGRRDYCADLVNKCKDGSVSGVFGLRRSGKTSVLFTVRDTLKSENRQVVFIPCEGSLSTVSWKSALCKVVLDVYRELDLPTPDRISEDEYENGNAASFFEEDLEEALYDFNVPITLMFDEIEHITFGLNLNENSKNLWWDGTGFVNFWGVIKGYYHKHPGKISIIVAGTNPMINEVNIIKNGNLINPMLGQLSATNQGAYLRPFTLDDTRTMINTLGSYMGLEFDDYCVSQLTTECAGHPYLIRLMCSHIHRYLKDKSVERPYTVTAAIYDACAKEFAKSEAATSFFFMILEILTTNYEQEFNVLKQLALGNETIIEKTQNENTLPHLIGYGLIDSNNGNYTIRYKLIEDYLAGKYKYERMGLTIEQQKAEINTRLGDVEVSLRQLTKNILCFNFGKAKACQVVIDTMKNAGNISKKDIQSAEKMSIKDLFDTSINKMYFSVLTKIISDNYSLFSNVFGNDKNAFDSKSKILNQARRCPSHSFPDDAKGWSQEQFLEFRNSATFFEDCLKDYQ